MAFLMVCNLDTPPVAPAACPVENITYIENFWDSGLTLEQTSELMGGVILLWVTAYLFTVLKRMFF